MSRGLSTAFKTLLQGQSFQLAGLVELEGADGVTYRYTDAANDITYDGNTYEAQGNFLSFGETEENTEVIVTKLSMSISALDSANITKFAASAIINKPVTMRLAYVDSGTVYAVIIFKGKVSGYSVQDAKATATINLEIASNFANFERINTRMTNIGSWQQQNPTDWTMEFAYQDISDISWGKKV